MRSHLTSGTFIESFAISCMFKASGKFDSVDTQITGLGEIKDIQQIYVDHTAEAMK